MVLKMTEKTLVDMIKSIINDAIEFKFNKLGVELSIIKGLLLRNSDININTEHWELGINIKISSKNGSNSKTFAGSTIFEENTRKIVDFDCNENKNQEENKYKSILVRTNPNKEGEFLERMRYPLPELTNNTHIVYLDKLYKSITPENPTSSDWIEINDKIKEILTENKKRYKYCNITYIISGNKCNYAEFYVDCTYKEEDDGTLTKVFDRDNQ